MIAILGAGGHGLSTLSLVLDIFPNDEINFLDDTHEIGSLRFGFQIIGEIEHYKKLPKKTRIAIAIADYKFMDRRAQLSKSILEDNFNLVKLVHPSANVDAMVSIGEGCQIHAGATVRIGSELGRNTLINTNAVIDHEVKIGTNSIISPSSVLLGKVKVDDNSFIGANTTIFPKVEIGRQVIIGAHSMIKKNIPSNCKAYGVPAKLMEGKHVN